MTYARDDRHVLRGCLLVLLAIGLLLLLSYALLTRGFSVPIQCVFGQETTLRATFDVDVRDADAGDFEQALRRVAARRKMVFGATQHPSFPSGRRRVTFDVCDREAHLVAMRNEDADTYSIFVSQAVSAPPDKANLLANDVREWLSQRRRR